MNAKAAFIAVALVAAAPAYAGDLSLIAQQTGLSERKVQMLMGNRTPFAEYTRSYERAREQFENALGKERAADLLAGRTITLDIPRDARVATTNQAPERHVAVVEAPAR
ncbi:hypothetical protein [Montanilutibacter psychrotolerans]|uniref:DUF4148 domain-containing protein n=1 Tax=Montanilutibacter psychrotolerans TaxID=1327343 RepID=A0A3M8T5E3_9GAMM|nr:hypothetical protein [Lysobacter psychrotolerans]RNF85962.1 hypothetical protein EER27_00545 [Lysobacter psychrotolerans]